MVLAKPKSQSLRWGGLLVSNRVLSNLRSRCATLWLWQKDTASMTWMKKYLQRQGRATVSVNSPFVYKQICPQAYQGKEDAASNDLDEEETAARARALVVRSREGRCFWAGGSQLEDCTSCIRRADAEAIQGKSQACNPIIEGNSKRAA